MHLPTGNRERGYPGGPDLLVRACLRGLRGSGGVSVTPLGVAWIVARGNRRLRYIATIKNDVWLHTRAAALNLRRLISLGPTRTDGTWAIVPSSTER